jgi:hypothetical protein
MWHEAAGEGAPRTTLEVPVTTRGVLYLHSAPRALCPHVEWAVGGVLDSRVSLDWTRQPAAAGSWRTELSWQGEPATASRLASALRGWQLLRFEVTAEPGAGCEGERYSSTPELGIFHAVTGTSSVVRGAPSPAASCHVRSSMPAVTSCKHYSLSTINNHASRVWLRKRYRAGDPCGGSSSGTTRKHALPARTDGKCVHMNA